MLIVSGGTYTLGETDVAQLERCGPNNVLPLRTVELADFCVDRFPLPGVAGDPWPGQGIPRDRALDLDRALRAHGRRLCSVSELVLASAGPENWRYPTGKQEPKPGACDPNDESPSPIGSFEG